MSAPSGSHHTAVPTSLRVAADISWRIIVVAVVAAGVVFALASTREIVIPVAVALLLTALLQPVVDFCDQRTPVQRHYVAALTVLVVLALVLGIMTEAGHQIVSGVADLKDKAGDGITKLLGWLQDGPLGWNQEQLQSFYDSANKWLEANQNKFTSGALSVGTSAVEVGAGTLIALITTFFFLADGGRIWSWVVHLMPRTVQGVAHNAMRRGWVSLGSYARTQVIVAAVDAVGIALGALVLGVPFVVPIGILVFFASFVPVVGAIVSGAVAVLVAFVAKDLMIAALMLLVVIIVQQVESHVLQPVLMSKAVSIHPLAVILGVAVGSFLMGLVGALFAVPIMAITNSAWLYAKGYDLFPYLGFQTPLPLRVAPPEHHPEGLLDDGAAVDADTPDAHEPGAAEDVKPSEH